MSSNQTLILDAIDARMALLLPSYSRLKYSYDLEKNNTRGETNAWGAGAGGAEIAEGVMKSLTLAQSFFVVISDTYTNRSSDLKEVAALKSIYDALEVVTLDFISSKVGIPATVLVVEAVGLDEPENISENTISVKANFIIRHRKATT